MLGPEPNVITLYNVTVEDEGWYSCVAGNSLGWDHATAYVAVLGELSYYYSLENISVDSFSFRF